MSTATGAGRDGDELADWRSVPLGTLIRRARLRKELTQAELAKQVKRKPDQIRAIEAGNRQPSLDGLVRLVAVLVDDRDSQVTILTHWLTKLEEHRLSTAAVDPTHAGLWHDSSARLLDALAPAQRRLPPPFPRSLEGFPEQYQPLVAVFPDRREVPPNSPADLFIRSGAVGDYQFLGLMRGMETPLTICSDKLFVVRSEEWLAERFSNAHFLIVGSGAVNWLTRTVAPAAVFRPQIDPVARAWAERYLDRMGGLDEPALLNAFWHLLETAMRTADGDVDVSAVATERLAAEEIALLPDAAALVREVLEGQTEVEVRELFDIAGFADPAQREQHRPHGGGTDLGVVSLAPHPFDRTGRFVSILCAGIAGPGTALGLKALLSDREALAKRPFGGVIGVVLPPGQKAWPGRYEDAFWQWRTLPYSPADVLANLRSAKTTPGSRRRAVFRSWPPADVAATTAFVEQLMGPGDVSGVGPPAP